MLNNLRNYILLLMVPCRICFSQTDSVVLNEVIISAYLSQKPVLRLPSSAALIDTSALQKQAGQSLVPVLNTVPGVRMEERSPGSYRLSLRGSLIRSPFGVRNTKIYYDEFPVTNASGEAYLNVIDVNSIYGIEILKGPDGSLFGANSGGVVRLNSNEAGTPRINIGAGAGSYGLVQEHASVQQQSGKNNFSLYEGWLRSDGYRDNSALDRKFARLSNNFKYSDKGELSLLLFYSRLNYQTPGGLTLQQFNTGPKLARPATPVLPGAAEQQARIENNTLYAGVLHSFKITSQVKHVIAVFGSNTQFQNPFITNYEVREENNGGARTWLEFRSKENKNVQLTYNIGGEGQAMKSRISNYGNNLGIKDTVQAIDNVTTTQGFVFTRLSADLFNKFIAEISLSYNYNRFVIERQQPQLISPVTRTFDPQLMPRFALSYLPIRQLAVRAIVSRGYSPPSLQEVRASDNSINTTLQPESGWNYESGLRLNLMERRLWLDASVYYYKLEQAIVKRINDAGQEFFTNAGGTDQYGFESQLNFEIVKERKEKFIRHFSMTEAYTLQNFTFNNYRVGESDFSGNAVTGVPRYVSVSSLNIGFPLGIYAFAQYNYTSELPLNDANTDYAKAYHLIQLKAGWKFSGTTRFAIDIHAGVDNLLNETYSLGNDLNAVGGRYYNAAPGRNYFATVNVWF